MNIKDPYISIGKNAAIMASKTHWWKHLTPKQIVRAQFFTSELAMNFSDFQKAIEAAVGRPVFTHELVTDYEQLAKDILGNEPLPTLVEVHELMGIK